jgi:hypothetical protein
MKSRQESFRLEAFGAAALQRRCMKLLNQELIGEVEGSCKNGNAYSCSMKCWKVLK